MKSNTLWSQSLLYKKINRKMYADFFYSLLSLKQLLQNKTPQNNYYKKTPNFKKIICLISVMFHLVVALSICRHPLLTNPRLLPQILKPLYFFSRFMQTLLWPSQKWFSCSVKPLYSRFSGHFSEDPGEGSRKLVFFFCLPVISRESLFIPESSSSLPNLFLSAFHLSFFHNLVPSSSVFIIFL